MTLHSLAPRPDPTGRRRLLRSALRARSVRLLVALALVATTPSATYAVLAGPASAATVGSPAPAAGVVGDDQRDRYVGTGAIVLPSRGWQGSDDGRSRAAGCDGCRWRVTDVCGKSEFAAGACRGLSLGCPIGTERVRVWLAEPGQDWSLIGTTCLGDAPPVSRDGLGAAVADRAERELPALTAACDPPGGTLVGLAAVCRTGQPATGLAGVTLEVAGFEVDLDARARWRWAYGDGTEAWVADPGGPWPDDAVAHTYRSAGRYEVRVDAVWRAAYTVDGLGPFAVPGTLTQTDMVTVPVSEARAVLVG